MESNKLKETVIKNCTCYYFDDFDFDNILIDEKSYKNTLVYDISYKTLFSSKPLRIRFDKVVGFIKIDDGTRYLVLFVPEKHDAIYNRIGYLIHQKAALNMFFLIIVQKLKLIL